jgi:hypothetical protein
MRSYRWIEIACDILESKAILKFKVEDYDRARFTKSDRFLGKAYSERKGKRG